MASTSLRISVTLRCITSQIGHHKNTLSNSFRPRRPPSHATALTFSSRRRRNSDSASITTRTNNKKKLINKNVEENDDIDEDAFEALFRQLEEDLKNDDVLGDGGEDDEISEEELAKLEQELAEALDDDELIAAFGSVAGGVAEDEDEDEGEDGDEDEGDVINNGGDEVDDEDEEEEAPTKLKNWQMRRLAYALKNGRRKTSIKNLAAELCLDRSVVLKLLRDPPPKLVLMSAALPDKPFSTILEPVEESQEAVPLETVPDTSNPETKTKMPVHVMHNNWSARKRLKKVQVETLEQVYRRTKRPTNAMISSIVHVTNLPRKRVVKWFEDKRVEDGVPENRVPYQKSAAPGTVFTS